MLIRLENVRPFHTQTHMGEGNQRSSLHSGVLFNNFLQITSPQTRSTGYSCFHRTVLSTCSVVLRADILTKFFNKLYRNKKELTLIASLTHEC